MRENAGDCVALRIIGNFVVQAAAQGDTAGMLEHLGVYLAVLKSAGKNSQECSRACKASGKII